MKDETREILSLLNSSSWSNEAKQIEDYITNLQEENERLKELDENYPIEERLEEALKWKNIYKSRIDKANEYIKENTRWFDSEYAKIYGELVDCAGAKGDRLEVLVKPSNLSKILGGDKDVKEAKD